MEAPATLGAEVRSLSGVNAPVDVYVALIDEPLAAVGAGEALLLDVGLHVFVQLLLVFELNVTAVADEVVGGVVLSCVWFRGSLCVCSDVVSL